MNATIHHIAERGTSEGVIYRHFESKDQLFIEAVVEPPYGRGRQAGGGLPGGRPGRAAYTRAAGRDHERLYRLRLLVSSLEEILPLLGLVLGDPKVARWCAS